MNKNTFSSQMTSKEHNEYQNQVEALVKCYMYNTKDVSRLPCADLLLGLTGNCASLASDKVYEMRVAFQSLQAFLVNPKINKAFFAQFPAGYTENIGIYLSRLLEMIALMDNNYAYAEMALAEMAIGVVDVQSLSQIEAQFSEQIIPPQIPFGEN